MRTCPDPRAKTGWLGRLDSSALLGRGFRPFFLLAGLHASVFVPLWVWMATGWIGGPGWAAPSLWHAHEMVYGFALAAAAGFMLTAVPAWTGARPVMGRRLAALAALWLAGRMVLAMPLALSPLATAAVDLAFPCALLASVGPHLSRADQRRNRVFLPVLALLAVCAAGFHLSAAGVWIDGGRRAARMSVDAMALLVVLVGGRIVPSFTQNALTRAGTARRVRAWPALDRASLVAVWAVVACDALALAGPLAAMPRALAAALLATRMLGWCTASTWGDPLLWSLHVGFAWLPVGFALLALGEIASGFPAVAGLHALGVGCLGSMILSVMTRVALGHTGRPLIAPRGIPLAYLAVSVSALARIASVWADHHAQLLLLMSAVFFSGAFSIFIALYAPILLSPRIDGREG